MNINGFILEEELGCVEAADLHCGLHSLSVTNCLIWQEGLTLQPHIVYIIYAEDLPLALPEKQRCTFLCIGSPRELSCRAPSPDILWVRDFYSPELLLPMVQKIIRKYKRYTEHLTTLCNRADSLDVLTEFFLETFQNPLIILGAHWEILQIYQNREGCCPPFSVQKSGSDFLCDSLQDILEANTSRMSGWSCAQTEEGIPLECYTMYIRKSAVLRLCLMGITSPVTNCRRILLTYTANYLMYLKDALYYNQYQGMYCLRQRLQKYLTRDTRISPDNDTFIFSELESIRWNPGDTYLCMILKSANDLRLNESDLPRIDILTLYSLSIPADDGIFFLANLSVSSCTVHMVIEKLAASLGDSILIAGISTPFQNFYDFPDYCRQAQAAIRTGRELNCAGKIYSFQEYALDYIIKEGMNSVPLNILLYGNLKELLIQDKSHQTHYCETLKIFFQNHMSLTPTAKELNIHLSTLKYRLKRIHEILDLNLNDPVNKMYLQIILYMYEHCDYQI